MAYRKQYNRSGGRGNGRRYGNNDGGRSGERRQNRPNFDLHFFTGVFGSEGKVFARACFDIDRLAEALDRAEQDTQRDGKIQLLILHADRGADYWVALSGASPSDDDGGPRQSRGRNERRSSRTEPANRPARRPKDTSGDDGNDDDVTDSAANDAAEDSWDD